METKFSAYSEFLCHIKTGTLSIYSTRSSSSPNSEKMIFQKFLFFFMISSFVVEVTPKLYKNYRNDPQLFMMAHLPRAQVLVSILFSIFWTSHKTKESDCFYWNFGTKSVIGEIPFTVRTVRCFGVYTESVYSNKSYLLKYQIAMSKI